MNDTALAPAPTEANTPSMRRDPAKRYAVFDNSARMAAREHAIQPTPGGAIRTYRLLADKACYMPLDHARWFLLANRSGGTDTFRVFDAELQQEVHLSMGNGSADAPMKLAPNQVVANLDELTQPALLARCRMTMGGQDFPTRADKRDLIQFLTDAAIESGIRQEVGAEHEAGAEGRGGDGGNLIDDDDDPDGDADAADTILLGNKGGGQ